MKIGNHNRKTIASFFFLRKFLFFLKPPKTRFLFMSWLCFRSLLSLNPLNLNKLAALNRLLLLWIGCFSKLWMGDYLVHFKSWASLFKALFTCAIFSWRSASRLKPCYMCDVSWRFSVHAFTHYRKRDTVINQCKGRKGVHAFTCFAWS